MRSAQNSAPAWNDLLSFVKTGDKSDKPRARGQSKSLPGVSGESTWLNLPREDTQRRNSSASSWAELWKVADRDHIPQDDQEDTSSDTSNESTTVTNLRRVVGTQAARHSQRLGTFPNLLGTTEEEATEKSKEEETRRADQEEEARSLRNQHKSATRVAVLPNQKGSFVEAIASSLHCDALEAKDSISLSACREVEIVSSRENEDVPVVSAEEANSDQEARQKQVGEEKSTNGEYHVDRGSKHTHKLPYVSQESPRESEGGNGLVKKSNATTVSFDENSAQHFRLSSTESSPNDLHRKTSIDNIEQNVDTQTVGKIHEKSSPITDMSQEMSNVLIEPNADSSVATNRLDPVETTGDERKMAKAGTDADTITDGLKENALTYEIAEDFANGMPNNAETSSHLAQRLETSDPLLQQVQQSQPSKLDVALDGASKETHTGVTEDDSLQSVSCFLDTSHEMLANPNAPIFDDLVAQDEEDSIEMKSGSGKGDDRSHEDDCGSGFSEASVAASTDTDFCSERLEDGVPRSVGFISGALSQRTSLSSSTGRKSDACSVGHSWDETRDDVVASRDFQTPCLDRSDDSQLVWSAEGDSRVDEASYSSTPKKISTPSDIRITESSKMLSQNAETPSEVQSETKDVAGVEQSGQPIEAVFYVGAVVETTQDIESDNETPMKIPKGTIGVVQYIDGDGDPQITFDGIDVAQWIYEEKIEFLLLHKDHEAALEHRSSKDVNHARTWDAPQPSEGRSPCRMRHRESFEGACSALLSTSDCLEWPLPGLKPNPQVPTMPLCSTHWFTSTAAQQHSPSEGAQNTAGMPSGALPAVASSPQNSRLHTFELTIMNNDRVNVFTCPAACVKEALQEAMQCQLVFVEANAYGDQPFSCAEADTRIILVWRSESTDLARQAENAAGAGAKGIIAAGWKGHEIEQPEIPSKPPIPIVVVSLSDGLRIVSHARDAASTCTSQSSPLFALLPSATAADSRAKESACSKFAFADAGRQDQKGSQEELASTPQPEYVTLSTPDCAARVLSIAQAPSTDGSSRILQTDFTGSLLIPRAASPSFSQITSVVASPPERESLGAAIPTPSISTANANMSWTPWPMHSQIRSNTVVHSRVPTHRLTVPPTSAVTRVVSRSKSPPRNNIRVAAPHVVSASPRRSRSRTRSVSPTRAAVIPSIPTSYGSVQPEGKPSCYQANAVAGIGSKTQERVGIAASSARAVSPVGPPRFASAPLPHVMMGSLPSHVAPSPRAWTMPSPRLPGPPRWSGATSGAPPFSARTQSSRSPSPPKDPAIITIASPLSHPSSSNYMLPVASWKRQGCHQSFSPDRLSSSRGAGIATSLTRSSSSAARLEMPVDSDRLDASWANIHQAKRTASNVVGHLARNRMPDHLASTWIGVSGNSSTMQEKHANGVRQHRVERQTSEPARLNCKLGVHLVERQRSAPNQVEGKLGVHRVERQQSAPSQLDSKRFVPWLSIGNSAGYTRHGREEATCQKHKKKSRHESS